MNGLETCTLTRVFHFFPCECGGFLCHDDFTNLLECPSCGSLYLRGLDGLFFRPVIIIDDEEINNE